MSDIFNISVYHDHHDFEGDGDTVPVVGYEIELDDGKIIKVFQKDTLLCSEDYGCCLINSNTNSMIHHIVGIQLSETLINQTFRFNYLKTLLLVFIFIGVKTLILDLDIWFKKRRTVKIMIHWSLISTSLMGL